MSASIDRRGCGSCAGEGCRSPCAGGDEHVSTAETREEERASARPCRKCGDADEVYDRLCAGCFRNSIFGKFKLAVTSNAMISPVDNILVAFSGGPGSRLALHFAHEMQLKAQKSWEASKDQSLPVFGIGVAFIDESSILPVQSDEVKKAIEQIQGVVLSLAPPTKELYVTPLESIWSLDSLDGKSQLTKLLDMVKDATGKEDLLQYMRMLCLQKIALENGFSKLLLGSCMTGIACHVLAATVKGQGYSLPADVQYIDSRWEIPIVYPLRDCLAQELNMLCHMDGLKTQQILVQSQSGINGLVSSFLARLQEENPSRARTIVRTAEKLRPFSFNKLGNVCSQMVPSRMRRKFQHNKSNGLKSPEVLCPMCGSPISDLDLQAQNNASMRSQEEWHLFVSQCCESCIYQILPEDASNFEEFLSLLPPQMNKVDKDINVLDRDAIREQIKDFLLLEDDEET